MISRHHNNMHLPKQQAENNLTYLEFIAAVDKLWTDSHPRIPLRPTQSQAYAEYPVITYKLDIRRPHTDEPKPKMREQFTPTGDTEVHTIYGQRFLNMVRFTAIDPDPQKAERIIEAFEDFMVEYTPVLKRLGASELTYARRYADNDEDRPGEDVSTRAVGYSLTTEKLYETSMGRIEQMVLDVRMFLSGLPRPDFEDYNEGASPIETNIIDLFQSAPAATPLD